MCFETELCSDLWALNLIVVIETVVGSIVVRLKYLECVFRTLGPFIQDSFVSLKAWIGCWVWKCNVNEVTSAGIQPKKENEKKGTASRRFIQKRVLIGEPIGALETREMLKGRFTCPAPKI
jgi:hypothetical protein